MSNQHVTYLCQGFLLHACDEFEQRCPNYDRPLTEPLKMLQVTRAEALRLFNSLQRFELFLADNVDPLECLDETSSMAQVKKVYRRLSLSLHPDKLLDKIIQTRRGKDII